MKKGLVIGAAGFVGRYLVREMRNNKIETFVTKLPGVWRYLSDFVIATVV